MTTMRWFLRSCAVTMQLMRRDFVVQKSKLKDQFINVIFLHPILWSIANLIQTNIFFGAKSPWYATVLFAGAPTLPLLLISYHTVFELFYDLEGNRFINYQLSLLDARFILIERLIVSTIICFLSLVPYYPISYFFVLKSHVSFHNVQWGLAYLLLFLASLCLSAYHLCAAVMLRKETLNILWNRVNHTLMALGGVWIPSSLLKQWWEPTEYFLLFNPLHYISDGLRGIIVPSPDFMPYQQSVIGLCVLSILFTITAIKSFRKRVDHV